MAPEQAAGVGGQLASPSQQLGAPGTTPTSPAVAAGGANHLIPVELALKVAAKIRAGEPFACYILLPLHSEGRCQLCRGCREVLPPQWSMHLTLTGAGQQPSCQRSGGASQLCADCCDGLPEALCSAPQAPCQRRAALCQHSGGGHLLCGLSVSPACNVVQRAGNNTGTSTIWARRGKLCCAQAAL